jgi:anti-sigma factor RsiW
MNHTRLHLTSPHLSDDQLIAHLYGIADEAHEPHLDSCPECQVRWAAIEQRRASLTTAPPVSEEILVRQRRAVLENAAPSTPLRSPWLPAGAAVLALAAIVLLRPSQQPSRTLPPVAVSDPAPVLEAGWFDEAYASSVSVEPRAAQPLRELFSSGEQTP